MTKADTAWYELIGATATKSKLINCDFYSVAFSAKEIKDVEIKCDIPMVKVAFVVTDRDGNDVFGSSHDLPSEGAQSFILKDVLPIKELERFETEDAKYSLILTVTFITGDEVSGTRVFKGLLHKGESTTELPEYDFLDKLNAIPVAKPGMSEDELRQICIDYMTLETEFTYKFKEDFDYCIVSQSRDRKLKAGNVYAGIPYVTRGAGNLYRIAEFYDADTGEIDTSGDIFKNIRHFGNACSGSACTAWARVVTSAYLGYTMFLTEANGFLPVGPYRYPQKNVTKFIKKRIDPNGFSCDDICKENGEQVMFESYALMKPADGVGCNGHVRMNSKKPHVVRNADGTIDGDRSYAIMTDQVCYATTPPHLRIAPDGTHYTAQGAVNAKFSFRVLFDTNYIPFTFAEFKNPELVEDVKIRLAVEPELEMQVLSCNYPISDIFCDIDGKRYVFRNEEFFRKEVKLGDVFPKEALSADTVVSCRLYNGETYTVDTRR